MIIINNMINNDYHNYIDIKETKNLTSKSSTNNCRLTMCISICAPNILSIIVVFYYFCKYINNK